MSIAALVEKAAKSDVMLKAAAPITCSRPTVTPVPWLPWVDGLDRDEPRLYYHDYHDERRAPKGRCTKMCRNIKTLANFDPPATDDEIRASAIQFVRKLSGTTRPSRVNEEAFTRAVDEVATAAHRLIRSLRTSAPPRDREEERRRARERALKRFGPSPTPPSGDEASAMD
jgi:hypothetical protein